MMRTYITWAGRAPERSECGVFVRNPEGMRQWGDLEVDGWITLKYILEK
jgi:hypothetical protein